MQGDDWYTAAEVSNQLESITAFRLYNLSTYVGDVRGQLSSPPERSYCPENTYLKFEQTEGLPFRIGLDGKWNALPRIPNELSPNIESYRDLVQDKLKKNGIKNPEIQINKIYQVDLDGDGGDEILIFPNHFKNGLHRGGVYEGDYSLLFLRKLKGNDVITVPLYERYVTADFPDARAAEIELVGLLDLNGDGVIEILAGERMSKGYRYHIYDSHLDNGKEVLTLYCGE